MSKKSCDNCECSSWKDSSWIEVSPCYHCDNYSEWQESELSKYQRKANKIIKFLESIQNNDFIPYLVRLDIANILMEVKELE